jgi:plastocyanin
MGIFSDITMGLLAVLVLLSVLVTAEAYAQTPTTANNNTNMTTIGGLTPEAQRAIEEYLNRPRAADDAATPTPTPPPPTTQQSSQMQQQTQQPINHGASVFIVQGSSILTTDAYSPNPIQVSIGDTVTWINNDVYAHTITSGSNGVLDHKFNSSPNYDPLIPPGARFSYTFTEVGIYPYFCLLHSNMVGTVSVS